LVQRRSGTMDDDGIPIGERLFSAAAAPRVLIAEDEPIVRLDLRQLFEQNGFDVCAEVRDGSEAVALTRDLRPEEAILDLKLPELEGSRRPDGSTLSGPYPA
jgi:PleD family two-component response regulator